MSQLSPLGQDSSPAQSAGKASTAASVAERDRLHMLAGLRRSLASPGRRDAIVAPNVPCGTDRKRYGAPFLGPIQIATSRSRTEFTAGQDPLTRASVQAPVTVLHWWIRSMISRSTKT